MFPQLMCLACMGLMAAGAEERSGKPLEIFNENFGSKNSPFAGFSTGSEHRDAPKTRKHASMVFAHAKSLSEASEASGEQLSIASHQSSLMAAVEKAAVDAAKEASVAAAVSIHELGNAKHQAALAAANAASITRAVKEASEVAAAAHQEVIAARQEALVLRKIASAKEEASHRERSEPDVERSVEAAQKSPVAVETAQVLESAIDDAHSI